MSERIEYAVGIDLGGTFIKAGIVDSKGRIRAQLSADTEVDRGLETVVRNIAASAEMALEKAGMGWGEVIGVGLGSPGIFDFKKGVLTFTPNLTCLNNSRLAHLVKARLDNNAPVFLENDANCAALGEQWAGVGRNAESLVLFTLGTGIGGGVILDGKVWHGSRGVAAELGHQSIIADGPKCGCGNRGCLEVMASATATVRRFKEAVIYSGKRSALAEKVLNGEKITSKMIYEAAMAGDGLSAETMRRTGAYLGVAVANMVNILDPQVIAFTGGMTAAGELLMNPIIREAQSRLYGQALEGVQVVYGELGNDAGLIGAAACAFNRSGISA